MATKTLTKRTARKATKTAKARKTECPKCGHALKVMKFKGEKKGKITCPDCGWREDSKPTILGLPIEGADNTSNRATIADLIEDYVDTEGMELPEPDEKLSPKQQATKDKKFVERQKAKQEREAAKQYHGPAIPATKVFRRDMPEFKNCKAECWMLINEQTNTYTFANTYNDQLKASYQSEHYTYSISSKAEKKIAKKQEEMVEVEVTDWPTWITNAAPKRTRKSK